MFRRSPKFVGFGLLVFLLVLGQPALSAPQKVTPQRDSAFGVNSHIASRYTGGPEGLSEPANLVINAGAGWVREDFQMKRLMPTRDTFDWMFQDPMVDLYSKAGVKIIGILNAPTPAWGVEPGKPADGFYPATPSAFAEFASQVVNRYKDRIHHWEVWNEPDNAIYWQDKPDPAAYTQLLQATYAAIKAADPSAKVLVAGMVSPQPAAGFLEKIAESGGWNAFDILALHPYTDPAPPETVTAGIETVKTLLKKYGDKPIWATEYGWSNGPSDRTERVFNEEEQANYLVRGAVLQRSIGVEKVIWYFLKDEGPINKYGLVKLGSGGTDYSQTKPAYLAFKTLNEQLSGTTPKGLMEMGQKEVLADASTLSKWPIWWDKNTAASGTAEASRAQSRQGSPAVKLSYTFPSAANEYMLLDAKNAPIALPADAYQLGLWVYGDGSGHQVKVQLRDSQGEKLQFVLGTVGLASEGWKLLEKPITGDVEDGNVIEGKQNKKLDPPAKIEAIILDDEPDTTTGARQQGAIYLDDLIATRGSEAYGARFQRDDSEEIVDVLWSPNMTKVTIPTTSLEGQRVEVWGEKKVETPNGGHFTLGVGPNPIFLTHKPGQAESQPTASPVATVASPVATAAPGQTSTPATYPGPDETSQPLEPTSQSLEPTSVPTGPTREFPATGFAIFGEIQKYWEGKGGLKVFGYPIEAQRKTTIEEKTFEAQWFERNRLELHPENKAPYNVLLGRLGADRLNQQKRHWEDFPPSTAKEGCLYFAETKHNVCWEILKAWKANGVELDGVKGFSPEENKALFGLPLSDLVTENLEGKEYTVQWFERARFELHPENKPPEDVQLGLLGNEIRGKK